MRELVTFLGFVILTLIMRVRQWPWLNSRYLGGYDYDAGLYVWLVEQMPTAISPRSWFQTNAFYPYGYSLAWSDNYILPGLIFQALWFLSKPLRYNLIFIACGALNGYCSFRLARFCLGARGFWGAVLVGVAFATFGFLQQHYGHPQLQWAFWVPMGLEALAVALIYKSRRAALISGLTVTGAFFSGVYYAIFLAMAFCVVIVLFSPRFWLAGRFDSSIAVNFMLVALGCSPVCLAVPSYLQVGSAFGNRNLFESFFFSATPLSYLAASSLSYFYSGLSSFSHAEARLFPGVVTGLLACSSACVAAGVKFWRWLLIFAVIGSGFVYGVVVALIFWAVLFVVVFCWYRGKCWQLKSGPASWAHFFLILGVLFVFVSLGPLGNTGEGQVAPGLMTVLFSVFPGFAAVRAVGRAGVMAVLFVTLASVFFLYSRRLLPRAICLLLLVGVVIDNWHPIVPIEGDVAAPKVLSSISGSGAVTIFLPLTDSLSADGAVQSWSDFSLRNVRAMNWANQAGLQVVNGYSGQRSMFMYKLPKVLADFPSQQAVFFLRRIGGLRYVVWQSVETEAALRDRLQSVASELKLLDHQEDYYLFELDGASTLQTGHVVRVPSWCDQRVEFELLSPIAQTVAIVAQQMEHAIESRSTELVQGKWQHVILDLKSAANGVEPYELKFNFDVAIFDAAIQVRQFKRACIA